MSTMGSVFLLLALGLGGLAQDANWGVKVKCYEVDGTVVCPGCNSRAGLSCPRHDNEEACVADDNFTSNALEQYRRPEISFFLWKIGYLSRNSTFAVQQQEEDEDTCSWNGDCPCPLICCKAGEGCPRRCKKGVRLPPPWG